VLTLWGLLPPDRAGRGAVMRRIQRWARGHAGRRYLVIATGPSSWDEVLLVCPERGAPSGIWREVADAAAEWGSMIDRVDMAAWRACSGERATILRGDRRSGSQIALTRDRLLGIPR